MIKQRFLGGILLIIGTSIGAGMLALPIANATTGFWQSSLFLCLCWVVMTLGALFILEVNLYLPPGNNMISMAQKTIGLPGMIIAWLSYLGLLYTLLCAYISGGADVLGGVFQSLHLYFPSDNLHDWKFILLFTLGFGFIVNRGIRHVDLVNRLLMFAKLAIYLLLVLFIAPYVKPVHLQGGNYLGIIGSVMILITSFGFAIIVPILREYFNDDLKSLKKVILIGSLIPLVCYVAWDLVIMGSMDFEGSQGLKSLMSAPHATSTLAHLLSNTVHNAGITALFNAFTSICMITAFLGVSLCLISFLSDGFKMAQYGREGFYLFLLTFMPPIIIVIFYPNIYIQALNYAGYLCVVLLLFLPALMSLYGRKKFAHSYIVPGGKFSQILLLVVSVVLIGATFYA